eukprot:CAMPEP_0181416628 /NCGR_PEP_ID=MMETSP1110-20121109/10627_1 /TAXON_ID=174948 /ORGANISM="Symbiodinium sp., Strain CCMP421" /LENGTH=50 /DNA_ID=CAMNT_0023539561 /DNA_START=97 /DNA_END=249 /DNA_ORIENTATION=-
MPGDDDRDGSDHDECVAPVEEALHPPGVPPAHMPAESLPPWQGPGAAMRA